MADQFKNLMIGLFITAAAAIIVFILMFLHPNIGDEGEVIRVRFTDVDKISIGTRVTYAGKPVGEVIAIDEIKDAHEKKTNSSGQLFAYELTLLVDSNLKLYTTDEISSRTSGLLGEKSIEITPYAPKEGIPLKLVGNEISYGAETGSVEETFKEFKEAANKFELMLDGFTDILTNIRNNKLVDKITHTIENIDSITTALNKPDQWNNILLNLDHLSSDLSTLMTKANKSWVIVDSTLSSADNLMKNGAGIAEKIAKGEGTVGKLIESEDLYLRTNSIMSKAETIMDDINHYGLLFSSDKGWQRLRARRLNLLQKLQTPQEFRNYFNDEINQISTSLSRVYTVLDAVENSPCCQDVIDDKEFTKVFAELMRRVKMLEEEVQMYNTQSMELKVHKTELGEAPSLKDKCQNFWEVN